MIEKKKKKKSKEKKLEFENQIFTLLISLRTLQRIYSLPTEIWNRIQSLEIKSCDVKRTSECLRIQSNLRISQELLTSKPVPVLAACKAKASQMRQKLFEIVAHIT